MLYTQVICAIRLLISKKASVKMIVENLVPERWNEMTKMDNSTTFQVEGHDQKVRSRN